MYRLPRESQHLPAPIRPGDLGSHDALVGNDSLSSLYGVMPLHFPEGCVNTTNFLRT